jgi:hypothetical protein
VERSLVYIAIGFSVLLPGLSKRALAQVQIPSAETKNAGPAAASLNGAYYVAWKGKNAQDNVWYATGSPESPDSWNPQQEVSWANKDGTTGFAKTTQAPALAAAGSTLYLAWRGQSTSPTDAIYYSTNTGSGWSPQTTVCSSTCQTTAAPALAATCQSGILGQSPCFTPTLYLAWATASNQVEVASYNGSAWTFLPPPVASPYPGTAPALAVYDNMLYLAWTQEAMGTFQVMYATYPLSGTGWNSPLPTPASSTVPVAPGLGVNFGNATGMTPGLYVAYIVESPSGATVEYTDWDDMSWSTPAKVPGQSGPGPLTPALVFADAASSTGDCTSNQLTFSLVYAANVSESYDDVYFDTWQPGLIHGCLTPPPTH